MKGCVNYLAINPVPVVFGSHSPVLDFDLCPFELVYFHELEEGFVSVHRRDLQLVFVPVLGEARLDVAFAHIKALPMDLCTLVADEDSKGDVEHGARIIEAINAIRIESISRYYLFDQLGLLRRLPLNRRRSLDLWRRSRHRLGTLLV